MALLTLDAIQTILAQYVGQETPNLTAQNDSLFKLLYSRKRPGSDDQGCRWKPRKDDTNNTSTHDEGGAYGAAGITTPLDALNKWARYAQVVEMSETAFTALRKGSKLAGDELANQADGAMKRIFRDADDDLRSNDNVTGDTNGFSGVPQIINDSNVFASIDRAVETDFQATISSGVGALTEAAMDGLHDGITHDEVEVYDTICASSTFVRDALALNGVQKADPPRAEMGGARQGYLGSFSMNKLAPAAFFNQRPIIAWTGWVENRMDFFRFGDLIMEVHKDFSVGLPIKVPGVDKWIIEITFIAQVKYLNPKSAGALTGLTT